MLWCMRKNANLFSHAFIFCLLLVLQLGITVWTAPYCSCCINEDVDEDVHGRYVSSGEWCNRGDPNFHFLGFDKSPSRSSKLTICLNICRTISACEDILVPQLHRASSSIFDINSPKHAFSGMGKDFIHPGPGTN